VADTVWPNYAYGRNAVYQNGDHGNALLSKFPFVHHRNVDVSLHGDEKRGLLYGHVEVPGSDLHLICVHFGLTAHHRRQQLQQLCTAIHEIVPADAPLVVAGDFNDWQQAIHAHLCNRTGLREVFVDSYGAAARTFPAWWPLLRLDRIYVRNVSHHQPIELGRKPWSHLSDHVPLAVTIDLRDPS
jgi:endonuclease/exonuclease/phosphatase family metal-dependent hydrolase